MNPGPKRLALAIAIGYGFSWIVGLVLLCLPLAFLALFMVFVIPSDIRRKWSTAPVIAALTLGFTARWLLLVLLYLHASYSTSVPRFYESRAFFSLAIVGPEVGAVYERGIDARARRQLQDTRGDLFDGMRPLKDREGILYGVGPNGIDGRGVIPYDPTNGVVSGGDIIISASGLRPAPDD